MERENYGRGGGRSGRGGRSSGDQRPPQQSMGRGGPSYGGDQRPNMGRGGPSYGDQRPPQQSLGRGGPSYGGQRPNMGRGGPNYGDQRPIMGQGGPSYGGDQRPNMGRGGPSYGDQRPNMGRGGPSYGGDQRPNMGRGGPSYGDQRPNMGRGGPSYGGDQRPNMGRGGPNYGDGGRGRGGPGTGSRQPQRAMPDMQRLRITEILPVPSRPKDATTNLFPVKRPDVGGTMTIRSPRLLVNHFPVKFNANFTIIHYDIDIKLESPPKGRPSKIIKSELRLIKDKLFLEKPSEFPPSGITYDGEKNIYSAVELPTGTYKVDFSIAEDMRSSTYLVSIKEVNRLKYSKLKDYLEGKVMIVPREILQGMDVVMKENPSQCRISLGRLYFPKNNTREDDLKWGITASKGFQHSLKSTSQGLAMCLDYSVLAFRKRLPVLNFLLEHFDYRDVRQITPRNIMDALKGVKVNVTHRATKQKFTIARLTDTLTRNTYFDIEEPEGVRRVSVVEYYREKYDKEIVHLDIPCFDFGKNNRNNYVPIELCVLVEGQRYPKEDLDRDAERLLKNMSLVKPHIRRNAICEMVKAGDGPSGGNILQNFGLQVVKEMTKVEARVIEPPQLKVGGRGGLINVDREKCQWNLVGKSVVEGKSLDCWAIIDFSSAQRNPKFRFDQDKFIYNIRNRCQGLGMRVEAPIICRYVDMTVFSNIDALDKLLRSVVAEADARHGKGSLQMIMCPMSAQDPGYKTLKFLSETKIGVVTQCLLSDRANEGKDQYLTNLAIKINAKLGGSNMELTHEFPTFPGEGPAMFIGADVNHPSPNSNPFSRSREDAPPSIAAVVGTMNWPAANRYATRVLPQYGRTEKIMKFGDMCKELIEAYAQVNGAKPQRIIVFRDGVSEGQFEMVLNQELFDLKNAIYDENYRPTITLVVAQKRHKTRLFPMNQEDGGPTGNVPPGTVVDTVITHPFEFDFYLNSHYGGIGTSKPTHYYVLYDDHNFTSDLLQKLCYDLCFTFARCTKPVSLIPPVYYADLMAYRGRMFQEAGAMMGSSSSRSVVSSSSSNSASLDEQLYKLHPELENMMFFV